MAGSVQATQRTGRSALAALCVVVVAKAAALTWCDDRGRSRGYFVLVLGAGDSCTMHTRLPLTAQAAHPMHHDQASIKHLMLPCQALTLSVVVNHSLPCSLLAPYRLSVQPLWPVREELLQPDAWRHAYGVAVSNMVRTVSLWHS